MLFDLNFDAPSANPVIVSKNTSFNACVIFLQLPGKRDTLGMRTVRHSLLAM